MLTEREECEDCSCAHDGQTPGFDAGECSCHKIGGAFIMAQPHEYRPRQEASR